MTIVHRSMLLVLGFLLASAVVITLSFVLLVVVLIFAMETLPAMQHVDIKIYQSLAVILSVGCYCYVMGTIIGKPLLAVAGWLKGLSEGSYDRSLYADRFAFLWNSRGKIRWVYAPFKDVVLRLLELSSSLERHRQEVEKTNEAKEQWLSGVSHDLQTPLSYVKGYLDVMVSPDIEMTGEEREQAMRLIKRKVDEIEGLLNTLQLQERPLALKSRGDLVRFVRDTTVDAANNPRSARYHFTFESSVAAYEYYYDPRQLKRVLQNVLMNAVLHNPEETRIAVRLDIQDHLRITVSDTGVGMPPSLIESLFAYRVRGETQAASGEGIGLAVVKSLVEAHQGEIDVKSAPNQGTVFTIKLPLHAVE